MSEAKYYEFLNSLPPHTERIEWIDDCRDTEVKLEEMKRIYGKER